MKHLTLAFAAIALALFPVGAFADAVSDFNTAHSGAGPAPVAYPDGAVGYALAACSAGDKCAWLTLPDGDEIDIYTGGGGYCKAFEFNVVRMHDGKPITSAEEQTGTTGDNKSLFVHPDCKKHFHTTDLQFDGGQARLTINLLRSGDLSAAWGFNR